MAKLYERTVAELMADAAGELEYPATRSDVVAWFAERYPLVRASTVRAHVVGLTQNDTKAPLSGGFWAGRRTGSYLASINFCPAVQFCDGVPA
jgi:hypothetical protein